MTGQNAMVFGDAFLLTQLEKSSEQFRASSEPGLSAKRATCPCARHGLKPA
jgi:hypothetical protein